MIKPIVWTIAGSDCSACAGIQADVKTLHRLEVQSCTVITAVTAQNNDGVLAINPMTNSVINSQLDALSATAQAAVIKIGLLANSEQVITIAKKLAEYKQNWPISPMVVFDPVAVATSGDHLTEDDTVAAIKQYLLPIVDVLTPNIEELQALSGVYILSWQCLADATEKLLDLGVASVSVKGGHLDIVEDHCVDFTTSALEEFWLCAKRRDQVSQRGTGCTYASALSAFLAQGHLLRDSVTLAKAYISQALDNKAAYQYSLHGVVQGAWPSKRQYFPQVLVDGSRLSSRLAWQSSQQSVDQRFNFCDQFLPLELSGKLLYPVVDSIEWLTRVLKAGVKLVQYREKNLHGQALNQAIADAVDLGKQYQACLFINDYWQLAIEHGAFGVHLGQEDLKKADLKQISQAGLRLGISTHGVYELLHAQQFKPSYLAIGAIFPTCTKDMSGQIQGIETLTRLVQLNDNTPIVAIGGINLTNVEQVLSTGVDAVAVVSAITQAASPETVIKCFEKTLCQY
ncbi:thiamine phosphate synthase [Thalassotalea ganghwensis]